MQHSCCGVGEHQDMLVGMWWGVAIPLDPIVDNTTAELLGIAVGRYVAAPREAYKRWVLSTWRWSSMPWWQRHQWMLHRSGNDIRCRRCSSEPLRTQQRWGGRCGGIKKCRRPPRRWRFKCRRTSLPMHKQQVVVRSSAQGRQVAVPITVPPADRVQTPEESTPNLEWWIHAPPHWHPVPSSTPDCCPAVMESCSEKTPTRGPLLLLSFRRSHAVHLH